MGRNYYETYLLACSSGMSTSLLVKKMEEEAEGRGIDVKIWAVAQNKAVKELENASKGSLHPLVNQLIKNIKHPKISLC
ncbi:PTS sugar transporter subunit IIB [Virgibacillus litoralis]|uniref:Cellobiose-specific phosphotransferase system component IIB n=1 Tax=Virgibacillus litoralis TaxID=578221 RepID=A0ABS4HBQ7_9BACI|nr:cellobiose-specific phosphotransferase system component IIB [Virgibacillus litoralis]